MSKLHAGLGALFLGLGCLLGVVALGTSSWEVNKNGAAYSGGDADDVVASRGLWESCVIARNTLKDVPCHMKPTDFGNLAVVPWVLRILICLGNMMSLLTFAFVVIWIFGYSCKDSYGWRTLVLLFSSLATFITMMPTLAYGLIILVDKTSPFVLGWSFGVAVFGSILLGPGTFWLCQHAHHLDDDDTRLFEKHTRSHQEMGDFQGRPHSSSYM